MTTADVIQLSYRVYLGEALAGLIFPWLVLVLWLRWLPRWPQTFMAAAITVAVMAPAYGLATAWGMETRTTLAVLGNIVGFLSIWGLRERTRPGEKKKPIGPDARWKLLLAMLGCVASLSVISVALHMLGGARPSRPDGMTMTEVAGPTFNADFKKAMDSRDAWAAYAAYREAARHRSTDVLGPTIKLYGELGDPTGMAFEALVAREEGREAERLELQRRAARAGDAMAKILVLESERGEHRVDDVALAKLSPEARAYSDELFSEGELTETIMRCYYIPSAGKEEADARCTKLDAKALKLTALSEVRWGTLWVFVSQDESTPVPLTPSVAYMAFANPNAEQSEAMIRRLPSAGNARGVWHRSAGWPGEAKHVPAVGQLLQDLRLGASLEDPESGVLLHEASFTPPYRQAVTPAEALSGLQMAARWGHPVAIKRLAALLEQGVGGVEANPTLALALLLTLRDTDAEQSLDDANRISATLPTKQREIAEFSAKTWRPGGLMVLFDPEKWKTTE